MAHGSEVQGVYLSEIFVSYQGEGEHAGEKHLFLRFAGCNMRCSYCDTPDSLIRVAYCKIDYPDGRSELLANPVSGERLTAIVEEFERKDPSIVRIALTGGEPLVQAAFLADWLTEAPPALGCLLETNAVLTGGLDRILARVEVVSADVKLPSNSGEGELWEEHRAFLEACRGCDVYVKMPVDAATEAGDVARAARLIANATPGAKLYVQPLTQPDSALWTIDADRLQELAAVAARELPDTHVLPQLHKILNVR